MRTIVALNMSHTMNFWERVIELRLRDTTKVTEVQFKFMAGRFTTEVILSLIRFMKIYWKRKKDLHKVFANQGKANHRVSRKVLFVLFEKKEIQIKHMECHKGYV